MPKLILSLIWIISIHGNTNPPGHIFFDEPKGGPNFLDKYLLFSHDYFFSECFYVFSQAYVSKYLKLHNCFVYFI